MQTYCRYLSKRKLIAPEFIFSSKFKTILIFIWERWIAFVCVYNIYILSVLEYIEWIVELPDVWLERVQKINFFQGPLKLWNNHSKKRRMEIGKKSFWTVGSKDNFLGRRQTAPSLNANIFSCKEEFTISCIQACITSQEAFTS